MDEINHWLLFLQPLNITVNNKYFLFKKEKKRKRQSFFISPSIGVLKDRTGLKSPSDTTSVVPLKNSCPSVRHVGHSHQEY